MGTTRGTRTRMLVACLFIALAVSATNAHAGLDATAPSVRITAPEDSHIFGPSEELLVKGDAQAVRGVYGVRVQYWMANKLQRDVVAACTGCGTPSATWQDGPGGLLPGYYVIKAYAVDEDGKQSDPTTRGFVTGAEFIPAPETPRLPETPTNPPIAVPGINPPKPGTLPGAEGPIPVRGITRPGSDVTIFERNLGPIATTVAQGDGRWSAAIRFPTGTYYLVAQATDTRGRISPVSKLVTLRVDATRPTLTLADGGQLEIFPPMQPVRIEGHVFDNRKVARVVIEYWLLDDMVLRDVAECPACGEQEAVWWSVPENLMPGYYYLKIRAFDGPGNPSWVSTATFITG